MITPNEHFWKVFKETPGALSCAEALAIMNVAAEAPEGFRIEFGTYKGKSAMSAMQVMKSGTSFYLVEPEFSNIDFAAETVKNIFSSFDSVSGIEVPLITDFSINVISNYNGYSYCFVDSGSHQDGLPMQEVKLLEDRLAQSGIIAFHDYKNQFTEVEQAYDYLVSTGKYEPIHINWQEIFDYVAEHNLEEGNNSWHQYPELPHPPNFVGALRKK